MSGLPDLPDEDDVKKRQMLLIGLVIIIILLVLAYAYFTNPSRQLTNSHQQRPVVVDMSTPGKSSDPIQNWVLQNENKLRAYEDKQAQQQEETNIKIRALMDEIKKLNKNNETLSERIKSQPGNQATRGFPPIPLPPRSSLPVNQPQILTLPGNETIKPEKTSSAVEGTDKSLMNRVLLSPETASRIVKIKFQKKGNKKKPHIRDTIPAGSFGQAVLLSGLDAPTGGLPNVTPTPFYWN